MTIAKKKEVSSNSHKSSRTDNSVEFVTSYEPAGEQVDVLLASVEPEQPMLHEVQQQQQQPPHQVSVPISNAMLNNPPPVPSIAMGTVNYAEISHPVVQTSKNETLKKVRKNFRITPEQDKKISEAFLIYGTAGQSGRPDWSSIAKCAGVEYAQAQKRYKKYLDPALLAKKVAPWTEEEKLQLIALANANKNPENNRINWRVVSDTLDRREVDCTSCYAHWMRAEEATAMKKGPFATSEDEVLVELIRNQGKSYAEVARTLTRPLATVRRRYIDLFPNLGVVGEASSIGLASIPGVASPTPGVTSPAPSATAPASSGSDMFPGLDILGTGAAASLEAGLVGVDSGLLAQQQAIVAAAEQEAAVLVASLDSTTNDSEDMSKV